MANEGSTKPTYSELERMLKSMKDALFNMQRDRETRTGREQRLTEELARVRGLLQRLWAHIWNDDGHGNGWFPDERCKTCIALYEEMKAEGAESADIGKLDAVDKTPVNDYTRASLLYDKYAIMKRVGNVEIRVLEPDGLARLLAGSAETGGEKA